MKPIMSTVFRELETAKNSISELEILVSQLSQAPSLPSLEDVDSTGNLEPYGVEAVEVLASIYPLIKVSRTQIVQDFYFHLEKIGQNRLELLSTQELASLYAAQAIYLENMSKPGLSQIEHKEMSLHAGRRHDLVSLPINVLIEAYQVYRESLIKFIPQLNERAYISVRSLLERRLSNDLAWQMQGYLEGLEQRWQIQNKIENSLSNIINQEDLVKCFFNQLCALPGVDGLSLASFVSKDKIVCETYQGLVLHCDPRRNENDASQYVWLNKAWGEQVPVWVNSIYCDIQYPDLKQKAEQLGLRSFGVIPLKSGDNLDYILIIYSKSPGFFLAQHKQYFFEGVAKELGNHIKDLEHRFYAPLSKLSGMKKQLYRTLLKSGQLEMFFQPIIEPLSGEVHKVEALARLKTKTGFAAPAEFLSSLNEKDLILLFEFGLAQGFNMLNTVNNSGKTDIGLSINFPTEAFNHPEVVASVQSIVDAHQANTQKVTLEILETKVLDENNALKMIHQFKSMGFRISMDDLGTGESSMLRMKTLPLDEVKIDQAFIRPLVHNLEQLEYIDALIRLASNLEVGCVVEGVENNSVLDVIWTLGDVYIQGYGIAKPMPLELLCSWLKNRKAADSEALVPLVYQPKTLSGWYARHFKRARVILDAIPNNIDLIDLKTTSDYCLCPLTDELIQKGMESSPIFETHKAFHGKVAEIEQAIQKKQLKSLKGLKKDLFGLVHKMREQVSQSLF